jgi:hypothetical protein
MGGEFVNKQSNDHDVASVRKPLPCMRCGKDLFETGFGNFVAIVSCEGTESRHYDDVYWACKGRCDLEMQVALGVERQPTPWKGIGELMNPLEYEWWARATSIWINEARVSEAAAEKINKLKSKLCWVANVKPTEKHAADFRMQRMLGRI